MKAGRNWESNWLELTQEMTKIEFEHFLFFGLISKQDVHFIVLRIMCIELYLKNSNWNSKNAFAEKL